MIIVHKRTNAFFSQKGKVAVSDKLKDADVLWRYVDTARFLDFLETKALFFCRGDQFEDKFEGAFTHSLRDAIESAYLSNKIDYTYESFKKELRRRVFVNCWHNGRDDSMAMWKIYGQSPCAVALTTTVGRLKEALESQLLPYHLRIERVEYVKHWRDPKLNIKPYSRVFSYKTTAYAFEKEVRVILDRSLDDAQDAVLETGIPVPISVPKLLRSVVISPEAPKWFSNLVTLVAARYGLQADVRHSKLSLEPV
ncbi:hypothetical protein [Ramlibacter algicola]|uniref:DUF2971 domain-containing protein n=1 Tax=Ramlibacter algicola TaxID=2795217 RepID=A0A934UR26_9BURK|nr:hypothetical protein [Ramlibacter algicola]MBK0392107.1 hypothetical protein [Ramlibacter algicola]